MKIAWAMIIVGLYLLPVKDVWARSAHKLLISSTSVSAFTMSQQALKVKDRRQATQMIKANYSAKLVSVVSAKVNGNPGYKAKLLGSDGVVFYVLLDAKTGQMKRR
mgnify:CR=1 FL=1